MRRILVATAMLLLLSACEQHASMPTAHEESATANGATAAAKAAATDPLTMLQSVNAQLAERNAGIAATAIEFFTVGQGRPGARIHQQEFRWVANDSRRAADGNNITYLVDQSGGRTASGLSSVATEAAIDRAMSTWAANAHLSKVNLVKRPDPGSDVTIYDYFFGYGRYGNYLAADIVNAGWYPESFFEAVGGPGGGRGILAFSVTFIFTDENGNPTDINGDNYLDAALNEVYYNDAFGNRRSTREGNPWGIGVALPGIDVETVALHENGHSLLLGHFGPPPEAVMNPVYAGVRHVPYSADEAGMSTVWKSWPK